ncbi:hypothetical protein BC936DRAFT_139781 [Jimgerdemannia flammicorona]|uniref:Uncharacterized protein n=1 Tax=Jimgerdemannia flammicorona TaxID=994334 RepID=A0A433DHG2_9FUNG|nr:hypothetical protein BC936DRAFT_139781 [Jimgerdemannia flammicorona]
MAGLPVPIRVTMVMDGRAPVKATVLADGGPHDDSDVAITVGVLVPTGVTITEPTLKIGPKLQHVVLVRWDFGRDRPLGERLCWVWKDGDEVDAQGEVLDPAESVVPPEAGAIGWSHANVTEKLFGWQFEECPKECEREERGHGICVPLDANSSAFYRL